MVGSSAPPMVDYNAPSSVRAIEALRTGQTTKILVAYASWFSKADAWDRVAQAMISVCDPDEGRPWNPARGSFMAHMRIVIRDLAHRERKSARGRREVLDSAPGETMSHPEPALDEALSDARTLERLRRLGTIVRERISHNARTLQVFDCACEGIDDAAELARLLDCTVQNIYAANRQIGRCADQVMAEDEAIETERMKRLRATAEKDTVTT
jgi:hypothetical protein